MRQSWKDYCTEHSEVLCDPNRQTDETLAAFLESMEVEVSEDDGDSNDVDDDDVHQHESTVWRIKEFQRGGPECQEAWRKFCDTKMGGVKDPAKHNASSMLKFLKVNESGTPASKHKKSTKDKHKKSTKDCGHMEFIRNGLKCSASFKKAWKTYCTLYHDGDTDPTSLKEADLSYFTDYLGQVLQSALADLPEGETGAPALKKRLAANDGGPAPKASRVAELEEPQEPVPPTTPPKKKLTMKKRVADEIRRLNASGIFSSQIKLAAVAEPLGRLDEDTALAVLRGVEEAAEGVEDVTETIVASVEATLNQEVEEADS